MFFGLPRVASEDATLGFASKTPLAFMWPLARPECSQREHSYLERGVLGEAALPATDFYYKLLIGEAEAEELVGGGLGDLNGDIGDCEEGLEGGS